MHDNLILPTLAVAGFLALCGPIAAQEDLFDEEDRMVPESSAGADQDLAKQSQNPVGDLTTLPFQNNTNFDWGPQEGTQNTLNIQPVLPVSLGSKWNLINRIIFPVTRQPGIVPGQGSATGLGDTTYTAFFAPKDPGETIWGAGPVFSLPTATDDRLGTDQFAVGPSAVILRMPGAWVVGGLFSNIWSVDGDDDDGDVNFFLAQLFVNYNKPSGWFYTTAPIITANWEAESGQKWTIPIGGGIGKVFRIGKQPVNSSVQVYYNVERPDLGSDWSARVQFTLLFPK